MMTPTRSTSLDVVKVLAALLTLLTAGMLSNSCWAFDNVWTRGAGNLNWNDDGNWEQEGVPDGPMYEDEGVIENGDTVFLATSTLDPAGIVLGRTASTFGGLEIRSGGSIHVVDSSGTPNGTVNVGVNGQGSLEVQSGGSLTAQFLNVSGQSSLTVGGTGSPATLAVASTVNLGGTTRIVGSGHVVSGGTVTFGGQGTLIADIRSANHSPVQSTGVAALGGNFVVEFGGGYTPTVGTSWDIVDAVGITGGFANIDLSAAPATGPGEVVRLATVAGGSHGQLLQLQYSSVLTLNVDWDTKSVSISSPTGQVIDIDGYSILSASGGLNVNNWNSLQDQTTSGWVEATPSSNALNELNMNLGGALSIGSAPRGLGTPFAPVFGPLGQSPEDLVLEYTSDTGEIVEGLVTYTGNRVVNNLLLTVDPATGEGQLKNSSPVALTFDGYSILSASGSLLPNNGDWLSLADQGAGAWQESSPTSEVLSELLTDGFLTLNPGQSVGLGGLFDEVGGTRDLALEFSLRGEVGGRTGVVLYGALTAHVDGDYNDNGIVDAADYTVWRNSLGQTGDGLAADGNGDHMVNELDYAYWKNRFGNSSNAAGAGAQATSVPEPSSALAAFIACLVAFGWRSGAQRRGTSRLARCYAQTPSVLRRGDWRKECA
jgi:Dockerin type I domain